MKNNLLFFLESLRMYTAAKTINRICKKDFLVPGTNYKIRKNDLVMIPLQGIHYDSELYPEPEKFNPDRYLPENKVKMHPVQFLPFGEGPRMCIGKIILNSFF